MRKRIIGLLAFCVITIANLPIPVSAQNKQFSLQVSPSPIVLSVKPGESVSQELKIRNTGTQAEDLKISLRAFEVNESGTVELKDNAPENVADWVHFSEPSFTVRPGEQTVENVIFDVPKDAAFTYSFALYISRSRPATGTPGKAAIEGSVAVFTLLSVDRPGAKAQLSIAEFSASKKVYSYLPAQFSVKLKNSGNTLVRPTGNIFVQRSDQSKNSLATLPVNESGGYILPESQRVVESKWTNGFPVYEQKGTDKSATHLVWNFARLQDFRFGHYVAKVVVIYNDGSRDIPVQATVGFWVIPWLVVGILLVVVLLLAVGVYTIIKKTAKLTNKKPKDA